VIWSEKSIITHKYVSYVVHRKRTRVFGISLKLKKKVFEISLKKVFGNVNSKSVDISFINISYFNFIFNNCF